jgi:L-fuconolactonase
MRIDAHHHLWRYRSAEFGWIDPRSRIACDFDADMLSVEMAGAGVDASIAVQARQTVEETRRLLDLAGTTPSILGVVGWVDLRADDITTQLDAGASPYLLGYRHVVQDEPDPEYLLADAFVRGVRQVVRRGLTYDLLVGHHQLRSVPAFLDRIGEGRIVLDHAAKPNIRKGEWDGWAERIAAIAVFPNVACKVSGLVTEADHATWRPEQIEPYLTHMLDLFGPDRLIWGSDWPVCLLAAPYAAVLDLVKGFVDRHCPGARQAVFADNAIRFYGLETRMGQQGART